MPLLVEFKYMSMFAFSKESINVFKNINDEQNNSKHSLNII